MIRLPLAHFNARINAHAGVRANAFARITQCAGNNVNIRTLLAHFGAQMDD